MDEKGNIPPEAAARFERTARLAQVGPEGLARLGAAHALVIGAGGLGSAALFYLAASGLGRITVVDGDTVEASNLNRQILFTPGDIGRGKAVLAAERLRALSPSCRVEPMGERVDAASLPGLLGRVSPQIVLDCTDNFPTRLAIADACLAAGLPLVVATAQGWEGQLFVQLPGNGAPSFRELLPEAPPEGSVPAPSETGVLGSVAGTMGCMQATSAIKVLLGIEEPLSYQILAYDGLRQRIRLMPR